METKSFTFLVTVETTLDSGTAEQIMRERICYEEPYDFPGGDAYSISYETNAPVYVIQSEDGDIIDVTTSEEWAKHQTRDDEDTPIRTLHEDTLWDGPEDRSEW